MGRKKNFDVFNVYSVFSLSSDWSCAHKFQGHDVIAQWFNYGTSKLEKVPTMKQDDLKTTKKTTILLKKSNHTFKD